MFPAHETPLPAVGLIDSGCSARAFADLDFITKNCIQTQLLPRPRSLLLADGKPAARITRYFVAPVAIGAHEELCLFFITSLTKDTPLIFGLPWLQRHNPSIDWTKMSITFTSTYCQVNCVPANLPPNQFIQAPTIPDPPHSFHDLPIPGEPTLPAYSRPPHAANRFNEINVTSKPTHSTQSASIRYYPPSVEDEPECPLPEQPLDSPEMVIPDELTPGRPHYRTYGPRCDTGPEYRAMMIPNIPNRKAVPVSLSAGCRRSRKTKSPKPPLPPLSVPLPRPPSSYPDECLRPDLSDIRVSAATNFLQFCKTPGAQVMKVTWDELDRLGRDEPQQPRYRIPDLPEERFRAILQGEGDWRETRQLFPENLHDFIDECFLPIHVRRSRIADADVEKFMKGKPELTEIEIIAKLPEWLRDLYDAFLPQPASVLSPHRSWDHKIELVPGKEPPYFKNRPMSPQELKVIRKWLDDNLTKGFIRESKARCAAPLLLAAKPGGGVRICHDYRGLNNVTIKNRYPLPLIRETLDALCHAKFYTKLDVIAAFNNLRIAEGHEWKTAFITRFGLFESLVVPFGLCNAPASFQNYINHVLFDILDKFCTAYLDDVLIYSLTRKEHRAHVREVTQRLREAGLQIDIAKCEFETKRTKYLGLIVTPDGIQMDTEKVKTIVEWKEPPGVKDLQKFLGFANFYRRFIKDFSKHTQPLTNLLKKGIPWRWEDSHKQAFAQLKVAFTSAPVLAFFDYNRKSVLETDASDWASGGVLSQYDDEGRLRPVAYFSAKHSAQECNYEIYDKELLAIIKALEEWRPELSGSQEPFEIVTDHKNLEYFTTTKVLNQRQVRWSEFLSQFNFRIVYRPGSKAARPDALSRRSEDRPLKSDVDDDRLKNRQRTLLPESVFAPETLADLLKEVDEDDSVDVKAMPIDLIFPDMNKPIDDLIDNAYSTCPTAALMLAALRDPQVRRWPKPLRKELRIAMMDCKEVAGRIYYRDKLFLPPNDELRTQVIYRTHSTGPAGHPGRVKTLDLVSRTYWWPRISRDVEEFVRACALCTRTKASRSAPPGFLQPLPVPFRAWSDISIDYITPLPECDRNGLKYKHLLVIVCRLTKMRHFVPVPDLTVETLASAFISRVYCLHGAPDSIVSDRGTQFIAEFWKQLSDRLGIRLRHSSAFHPETDGQTERVNAGVEQYLRAFMNFHQDDWVDWLPLAEFAANNVVSETTGVSPFFANYGFHPQLGIEPTKPCPPNLSSVQKRQFYKANVVADRFERILTQLKALARLSSQRYEENANESRAEAPRYLVGEEVYINTRNMKTNRPMKKGDDKWAGPYPILKVYPRSCLVQLPDHMKIFPVFHNSLLRPKTNGQGLKGQDLINEAESRNIRGRILERDDETEEVVEKWEFEALLDCHNEARLHYLVKWRYHKPTWQPASDLKGQDEALLEFHKQHPDKPGPPSWVKKRPSVRRSPRLRRTIHGLRQVCFAPLQRVRWF